ncbi:hypothetical protein [Halosolutus gelatinilyticus]|uniref:hypothetical protein n=1 Tax=Halosolutus gelatinilyticus TaxID=2931975 RepID=UPI001FF0EB4B|nr:hypothetical protein [Halosolutus gelatinilyticus]
MSEETGGIGRFPTRRELLAAIGGAAATSSVDASGVTTREAPLRVRVYPGPVSIRAWARYGFSGITRNWPPPFRDAFAAIEDALNQVLSYASRQSRLTEFDVRLERGDLVQYPLSEASPSAESIIPSRDTVLSVFRDQVRGRNVGAGAESTAHVLFAWAPLNYRLGYGGTHPDLYRLGRVLGDGAYTAVNLGATEVWDSRVVSRNMAIHETLHTLISPSIAEAIGGTECDHDLGTAVRTDDGTLRVSPMATAYAGPDVAGINGGTRWPGTGCADIDRIHEGDPDAAVDQVEYTTELSDATLEAVTRFLEYVRDRLANDQPASG